jgi:hypothetical protein
MTRRAQALEMPQRRNFERREVIKNPQIFRSYLHLVMFQQVDWERDKDKK